MGRLSGYGRRTVEQTRSIDINRLRRGGCAGGKPPSNWWMGTERAVQSRFPAEALE